LFHWSASRFAMRFAHNNDWLTVLEITIDLLRPNVRRHSNDRNGRVRVADIHGRRDSIKTGHDNIHEHHVEVIAVRVVLDPLVRIGTI
jgi:hypothetical protein